MHCTGIYKILNLLTGSVYIGSAINCELRRRRHFSILRHNKHYNKHLQNAFNKYGESAFIFGVITMCDKETLIEKEQYYIDKYKSFSKGIGYNISPFAGRTKGLVAHNKGIPWTLKQRSVLSNAAKNRKTQPHIVPHTQEARLKMSLSRKGTRIGPNHPLSKIVLNINTGIFYDSIKDAAESEGIKYRTLYARVTGENNNQHSSFKLV